MFDRARQTPEAAFPTKPNDETPVFDEYAELDPKWAKKQERRLKRRARLPLKFGAAAIILSSIAHAYWQDVETNEQIEQKAEISLNVISQAHDPTNNDKATIVIDGFNAYDANYLSKEIGPAIQKVADGQLWSLGYNNAFLNRDNIYQTILAFAKIHHIKSISIVGYSMGGIIATEAVSDIVKNSTIPVNSLVMISTPDKYDDLRPYQQHELEAGKLIMDIPGAAYSSWFRLGGEVYFYRNNYLQGDFDSWLDVGHNTEVITGNVGRFGRVVATSIERAENPKQTTMRLLAQQIYKIAQADIPKELKTINEQRGQKQMPAILYLGTAAPGRDYVVNDKTSSKNICDAAETYNLDCSTYFVPGAIHSQYYKTVDEYMHVFEQASGPIHQEIAFETKQAQLLRDPFQVDPTPLQ